MLELFLMVYKDAVDAMKILDLVMRSKALLWLIEMDKALVRQPETTWTARQIFPSEWAWKPRAEIPAGKR